MTRLGCAAYSYRDLLKSGEISLSEFVDTCAGLGLDGVELTSYYFPSTERGLLNLIKRHCLLKGVDVLGAAIGSNFTQADRERRREQVNLARDWLGHSLQLGAPYLRVFAGPVPEGVPKETARGWALECLTELIPAAEDAGVCLALENHGGVTATAEDTRWLLDRLQSPWLGLNLDFGNFSPDPYGQYAQVLDRAITTHAKLSAGRGDARIELDYGRIRKTLEAAGYSGAITIEYEEPGDPREGVPAFFERLRTAFR